MKLTERAMIRKRAGLTQHRLARLTGISASTISLWENHELELTPDQVEKIGRMIAQEINRVPAISTATEAVRVLSPSGCE
jgi:transcriptional regulator with XRE-family HTH domain